MASQPLERGRTGPRSHPRHLPLPAVARGRAGAATPSRGNRIALAKCLSTFGRATPIPTRRAADYRDGR